MAKHKKECDCIFCNSKCPKCGSETISVKFKMTWEYNNDALNDIEINHVDDSIEVECKDCREEYHLGEWGNDQRLLPLRNAILKEIDLPQIISVEIDEETRF